MVMPTVKCVKRLRTYRITGFIYKKEIALYKTVSRDYRSTSPTHAKQLAKRDMPEASYFHVAQQIPTWSRYKSIG